MADKLTLDRHAMKDRSTAHLRIYVGNLTENVKIEDLYEHFEQYGQINGIVLNRNFGFIQFENESSAQEAISKASGSQLHGKSLNVRTAQSNPNEKRYERCAGSSPPAVSVAQLPVETEMPLPELDHSMEELDEMHIENSVEPDAEQREPENPVRPRLRKRGRNRRRGKAKSGTESESALISDKREPEVVQMQLENPPAVVLTENTPIVIDDSGDEPYDSYGNYIGDQGGKKNFRGGEEEYDDGYNQNWNEGRDARGGGGGRGRGRGAPRGRGVRGRGAGGNFQERSPAAGRGGEWSERGGYDRYQQPLPDYPRAVPVTERNDCEIIVVSKTLTEYAEYIEGRLKRLGIVVDLLFPMEDVPIGKVLGNIASRGCLYAILVMPQNQENRSLTLTILHGLPQEHRNMPLEDALILLSRNFQEVQRGGPSGREAVYALLGQLADGRTLTVLQYDKVIEYLQERRENQVKLELGEPLTTPATNKTQVDLQQRIMSILNDKKVATPSVPPPVPAPATPAGQNKLLNDPTVRKALDSILMKFT